MAQTEKPGPSIEQVEATFGQSVQYMTGGQIENFREGWAKDVMAGKSAHYFRRNSFDFAVALCGKWVEARWIYGAGNCPRCRLCERIAVSRGLE